MPAEDSIALDLAAEGGRTAEFIGREIEEQRLVTPSITVGVGWVGGRPMSG
ncbi:MAG: hypothetical protein OEL76_07790 [Siculibacillus sp.]|nr:hypothetical protein [Siculibacillus sp.]